jgi:hypothetical protein
MTTPAATDTRAAAMDTRAAVMDTRAAAMDTRAPAVERAIATGHTGARTGGRLSTRISEVVVLSQHLFFLLFSFAWWAFGCSSAFGYIAVDLVRWQDLFLFLWRQISRIKTAADRYVVGSSRLSLRSANIDADIFWSEDGRDLPTAARSFCMIPIAWWIHGIRIHINDHIDPEELHATLSNQNFLLIIIYHSDKKAPHHSQRRKCKCTPPS